MHLHLKTAPAVEPITLDEAKLHLKVDSADDNALISALIESTRRLAEAETKRAFITQTWQMYLDSAAAEIRIPKPPLQSVEAIRAISATETTVDETVDKDQPILKIASTTGFSIGDSALINRDGEREEEKIILSIQADISLTFTTNLTNVHTAAQADSVEKYTLVDKADYNVDRSSGSSGRIMLREGYNWPVHRNFASFIIEFKTGYGDAGSDVPEGLKQGIYILIAHMYENRGAEGAVKARVHALEEAKIILAPYKIWII